MRIRRRLSVQDAIARHETIEDAESLASIDRPPEEDLPPAKVYHPGSPHVLALLAPASIFGVLARLGLLALTTYEGQSIFPLAYVQALGCLVMGFGLGLKSPLGRLYVISFATPAFRPEVSLQLRPSVHRADHG